MGARGTTLVFIERELGRHGFGNRQTNGVAPLSLPTATLQPFGHRTLGRLLPRVCSMSDPALRMARRRAWARGPGSCRPHTRSWAWPRRRRRWSCGPRLSAAPWKATRTRAAQTPHSRRSLCLSCICPLSVLRLSLACPPLVCPLPSIPFLSCPPSCLPSVRLGYPCHLPSICLLAPNGSTLYRPRRESV